MYKYPGGVEAHKKLFEEEGFTVTACGKIPQYPIRCRREILAGKKRAA
jgi:hypothetical protein